MRSARGRGAGACALVADAWASFVLDFPACSDERAAGVRARLDAALVEAGKELIMEALRAEQVGV